MPALQKEHLLGQIVERHDSMIRAIVLKKMGRADPDWEDIIQNIYLSIWIALDRFKGESAIRTYIYPIVNGRINDYLRTLYRREKLTKKAQTNLKAEDAYYTEGVGTLAEREEEMRKSRDTGFLGPAEFRVFKLIGQGKTNDEIAALLFISNATVRTHYKRIALKLEFTNRVKLALFSYRFLNGGIK